MPAIRATLLGVLITVAASAQTNLYGIVSNLVGTPLSGVVVSLAGKPALLDTTGANGVFSIVDNPTHATARATPAPSSISFTNNTLSFSTSTQTNVSVELFDVLGKLVVRPFSALVNPGAYRFSLTSIWPENVSVVRIRCGGIAEIFRIVGMQKSRFIAGQTGQDLREKPEGANALQKTAQVLDTLIFSSPGYVTLRQPISSYIGSDSIRVTLIPTYTVTYNGNGNTSGSVPVDGNSYQIGATVTISGNTGNLARTGYLFTGWNTATNGSGTSYASGGTFAIVTNTTLYAQWTLMPTCTVTYSGNGNTGGTAPVDGNSYQLGATVTVSGNTGNLARTGYTFSGWNTAANGSGTSYAGGATFVIVTNTTLYAQWMTIPTYSVTYSGNGNTGGSVPVDGNSYTAGATVTVSGNTGNLFHTGYTFSGWNAAPNGSGTSYAGGATFAIVTNTTLYAQWTPITFSVTYSGNGNTGGSVPVDGNSYLLGATVTVSSNTGNLSRTGYTFSGWNTAANGSGTSYAGSATFVIVTNTTLYAQWTSIPTYTVTYSGNGNTGGSVPVDGNSYTSGATVTVSGNTGNLSRAGYTFSGWNASPNGSGTSYAGGATFVIVTNTTLYAQWTTIPTYSVTYSGNGNTGGSVPVDGNSYTSGATVTVSGNTGNLFHTGYTFSGWNTVANGSGTSYAGGATFAIVTNTTLYAQWTAIPTYTVTYSGNGNTSGSVPVDGNSYTSGATVTVIGNTGSLSKAGYAFSGWNTAANGSGTGYAGGATFAIVTNTTLYAQW